MAIEPMKGLVGEECPSGKLIDLGGRGVKDLESGILRTVGQAEERIGKMD